MYQTKKESAIDSKCASARKTRCRYTKEGRIFRLNQSLRNRDKIKDDAIAQLSDHPMALTAAMQEIENRQQQYE